MASVSGKVTVDGQPLTAGQVTFIPDVPHPSSTEGGKVETFGLTTGQIGSDGTYKITTSGKSGAPLGKYKVTVTPSMVPARDAKTAPPSGFQQIFSDAQKTPLRKEVVANPEAGRYDLKLTK